MAATNTGATFKYNLAGRTSGILISKIIENSATIAVGDWVIADTTGYIAAGTAGVPLLGICVGIVDKDGINMDNHEGSFEGTWTSSTKTFVADSDNITAGHDQVRALIDIDPFSVWSEEPDAAIGTTTSTGNSALLGSYTDILDQNEVDENNGTNAFNAKAQLFIWGLDPENSARGLYSIAEHQIWGA